MVNCQRHESLLPKAAAAGLPEPALGATADAPDAAPLAAGGASAITGPSSVSAIGAAPADMAGSAFMLATIDASARICMSSMLASDAHHSPRTRPLSHTPRRIVVSQKEHRRPVAPTRTDGGSGSPLLGCEEVLWGRGKYPPPERQFNAACPTSRAIRKYPFPLGLCSSSPIHTQIASKQPWRCPGRGLEPAADCW